MKIYLLRHGETDWNRDGKIPYNKNLTLNETGIKQAEVARKMLENLDYDLVIASPFIRAKRTAEIANNGRKDLIIDDRLRERNPGILDGMLRTNVNLKGFHNYYQNLEFEGAENIQDFCKRVWDFLDEIKVKYKDKTILLVTHNVVIRAIKAYILGIPADGNIQNYGIKNGELEEYTI